MEEEAGPSWSPDSQRLVYECYIDGPTSEIANMNGTHFTEEAADICVIDANGGHRIHLIKDSGGDHYPVWSPNGLQIAYIRRDGIYVINVDGTNQRQLVHLSPDQVISVNVSKVTWSPDGKYLLFTGCLNQNANQNDIYRVDLANGMLTNLTQDNGRQDYEPDWTRNGTKIVFLSTNVPLREGSCFLDEVAGYGSTYQLRMMNIDGSDESVVYDAETTLQPFISTSTAGRVALLNSLLESSNLRLINLNGTADLITEIDEPVTKPVSWAPNEPWLLSYRSGPGLTILNVETGAKKFTPPLPIENTEFNRYPTVEGLVWSSHGQQIAVTNSMNPSGFYQEKHIYVFDLQHETWQSLVRR